MCNSISRIAIAGIALLAAGAAPAWAQSANGVVDWRGFYAGIYAGYSLDSNASSFSSIGPISETNTHNNGDVDVTTLTGNNSTSRISTLSGGARVGYDFQTGPLVLGAFTSLNLGNFGESDSASLLEDATRNGAPYGALDEVGSDNLSIDWYGTFEGKAGFAVDNWLFYAKGGVAFADASLSSNASVTATGAAAGGAFPEGTTSVNSGSSKLLFGTTIGAGAAVKLSDNISANVEYSYVNLPSVSADGSDFGGLGGTSDGSLGASFHTIRAGLDYSF